MARRDCPSRPYVEHAAGGRHYVGYAARTFINSKAKGTRSVPYGKLQNRLLDRSAVGRNKSFRAKARTSVSGVPHDIAGNATTRYALRSAQDRLGWSYYGLRLEQNSVIVGAALAAKSAAKAAPTRYNLLPRVSKIDQICQTMKQRTSIQFRKR